MRKSLPRSREGQVFQKRFPDENCFPKLTYFVAENFRMEIRCQFQETIFIGKLFLENHFHWETISGEKTWKTSSHYLGQSDDVVLVARRCLSFFPVPCPTL